MKAVFVLLLGLVFCIGCAKVQVQAPKEPIKVDISMRLDIYQHIEKDIDAIESIVSGNQEPPKPGNNRSLRHYFLGNAYAQEGGLSPEVEQAALRRRDRHAELISREAEGIVGENKSGLVEIRNPGAGNPSLEQLVDAENNDRLIIYQAVAQKNNSPLEEVQKIYAKRLQQDAPSGTPIEALGPAGVYEWKVK